jgi:hypothetical protein
MNLIEVIKSINVTDSNRSRLEFIDNTDYSKVIKKTDQEFRKFGIEVGQQYLDNGVLALKQYYAIAVLDPFNYHSVGYNVDPFWHNHILFTAEYRTFCDSVIGHYMDHMPLDNSNELEVQATMEAYHHTMKTYQEVFTYFDETFTPINITEDLAVCPHYCHRIETYGFNESKLPQRNETVHKLFEKAFPALCAH